MMWLPEICYNPRALAIANLHQFGPSILWDSSFLIGEGGLDIYGGFKHKGVLFMLMCTFS